MDDAIMKFDNLWRVLTDFAADLRNRYQDSLIRTDRVASGSLLNSVTFGIRRQGQVFQVFLNLEDYWQYVESGRMPGKWPPRQRILEWIKVKPVLPRPDAEGNLPTPEQLAFLISRKIGEEGFRGTHNLEETLDSTYQDFAARIEAAITADFEASYAFVPELLTSVSLTPGNP